MLFAVHIQISAMANIKIFLLPLFLLYVRQRDSCSAFEGETLPERKISMTRVDSSLKEFS